MEVALEQRSFLGKTCVVFVLFLDKFLIDSSSYLGPPDVFTGDSLLTESIFKK